MKKPLSMFFTALCLVISGCTGSTEPGPKETEELTAFRNLTGKWNLFTPNGKNTSDSLDLFGKLFINADIPSMIVFDIGNDPDTVRNVTYQGKKASYTRLGQNNPYDHVSQDSISRTFTYTMTHIDRFIIQTTTFDSRADTLISEGVFYAARDR